MSDPENFLSRWSRRKRDAETAPDTEAQAKPTPTLPAAPEDAPPIPATEEPAFDLTELPSLDEIVAETDVSLFMKPGVPAALRHAALRRAWASDPAIRDFRGLQENDWDFNSPESIPGFGRFGSEEEVKALARRLFGGFDREEEQVPQSVPQDNADATTADRAFDKDQEPPAPVARTSDSVQDPATQHEDNVAMQRITARRHGGALPE